MKRTSVYRGNFFVHVLLIVLIYTALFFISAKPLIAKIVGE